MRSLQSVCVIVRRCNDGDVVAVRQQVRDDGRTVSASTTTTAVSADTAPRGPARRPRRLPSFLHRGGDQVADVGRLPVFDIGRRPEAVFATSHGPRCRDDRPGEIPVARDPADDTPRTIRTNEVREDSDNHPTCSERFQADRHARSGRPSPRSVRQGTTRCDTTDYIYTRLKASLAHMSGSVV